MNELSRRLRALRIESGMSQSEVGRQVGLSRSAVTQMESGNRDVTAEELVRFSTAFGQSPVSLLSRVERGAGESVGEVDEALEEVLHALPGQGLDRTEMRASLVRLVELARQLTEAESTLGVAVYGPQAFAFRGTSPRTNWEAAHQGHAVAEEERQRLDLGSAPIRDVPETLATLRVRISRLALPETVSCVYLHTPETGALVVVNRYSSPEERRFWMIHGFAHLLFEPERRWLVCSRDEVNRRHEVRANAFAGRFLMPTRGVERYLHSMGRDTMGSSLGGVLEVFSDRAAVPRNESRVRVKGRARRGGREFNAFELSQVAEYFGVTRSLAAHVLRNLRFLSDHARDRLIDMASAGEIDRVLSLGRQARDGREPVAFLPRLLVLATEARSRGALSAGRVARIAELSGLGEEEGVRLLGTGVAGPADDPGSRLKSS